MSGLRALGRDIDHAIDGVSAPNCSAGTTNDLDPFDVFQGNLLLIPDGVRESWIVDAAAVNQHQDFVGVEAVEAPNADCPIVAVDPGHVDAGRHAQQVGDVGSAGTANVLLGDDEDGSASRGKLLLLLRNRGDINAQQVFQTDLGQIANLRSLSWSSGGEDRHAQR